MSVTFYVECNRKIDVSQVDYFFGVASAAGRELPIEKPDLKPFPQTLLGAFTSGSVSYDLVQGQSLGDVWWMRYPAWLGPKSVGEPWMSVAVEDGRLALSVSYSDSRFYRNAMDMVNQAVELFAPSFGGRVLQPDGERLSNSVDDYLPNGSRGSFFAQGRTAIQSLLRTAPVGLLEYPLGQADLGPSYLRIHLEPKTPPTLSGLISTLEKSKTLMCREHGESFVVALAAPPPIAEHVGPWVAHGGIREDGIVEISPTSNLAFQFHAPAILACADLLQTEWGVDVKLCGLPLTAELTKEAKSRSAGLGVEWLMWIRQLTDLIWMPRTTDPPAGVAEKIQSIAQNMNAICAFDKEAVRWLERYMAHNKDQRDVLDMQACALFYTQCLVVQLGGSWCAVDDKWMVRLSGTSTFVDPESKLKDHLDEPDVGHLALFVDVLRTSYVGKARDGFVVIS